VKRGNISLAVAITTVTALAGSWLTAPTLAAFSDTTNNPGNSFSAAASFCTAPGTQTVGADADAYVDQGQPTANFGTDPALVVRSQNGPKDARVLVHFALPSVSFCAVTSATLRLYASTATTGRTLETYALGGAWGEASVTWNNQPATAGSPSLASSATGWVQWDVTSHVQTMYASTNDGFLIKDSVETSSPAKTQTFRSREAPSYQPQLVLTLA
jgi:hypothetical protein